MTTQLQQLATDMATIKAMMEVQAANNAKVLKILEGNGQPGLVQRMASTERDADELTKKLDKAVEEITRISQLVETVNDTVTLHCKDGNPEHETLVVMFRRKPGQFVMAAMTLFVFLAIGVTTGFFEHVIAYFQALLH